MGVRPGIIDWDPKVGPKKVQHPFFSTRIPHWRGIFAVLGCLDGILGTQIGF